MSPVTPTAWAPTVFPRSGPACNYLAEGSLTDRRQRVAGLARHHGLDLSTLPVHVITASRLKLDQLTDREKLVETVRRLRPRMLLLDPTVRLHSVDENNASEVAKLISNLRPLQRRFDVAVILVHHTRKMLPPGCNRGKAYAAAPTCMPSVTPISISDAHAIN